MGYSIALRAVVKSFSDGARMRCILKDASIEFCSGKLIGIVGRSGLGKTTIIKLFMGIEEADTGEILVGKECVNASDERSLVKLRRHTIGCVFQNFNLVNSLTVRENILLPSYFWSKEDVKTKNASEVPLDDYLLEIVERLDLPRECLDRNVSSLSGGEKQRVAIARALIGRPDVLLADEPTGNLDVESEASVIELLKHVRDAFGMTVIVVTHSTRVAGAMDMLCTIEDGRIVWLNSASAEELQR